MIFQHIFLNCSFLEQSNALCNAFINFFLFVSWSKNHTLCLLYVYLMWHIFLYVYIYIYIRLENNVHTLAILFSV